MAALGTETITHATPAATKSLLAVAEILSTEATALSLDVIGSMEFVVLPALPALPVPVEQALPALPTPPAQAVPVGSAASTMVLAGVRA